MTHAPELEFKRTATARKPLLGQSVLVVEDSRHAGETMRLMCLRGGARVRRAATMRAADRHLISWRPTVVIVDLGLPDGSGLDLIARLSQAVPRVGVILAVSGDPALEESAAAAGADAFLAKPFPTLAAFQEAILRHIPASELPRGPRPVTADEIEVEPSALHDDLSHVSGLLVTDVEPATLAYAAAFVTSLGRAVRDGDLEAGGAALCRDLDAGKPHVVALSSLARLVQSRLTDGALAV